MKAVQYEVFGSIENLSIKEVPTPLASENEVQIKVAYAGVNPVEYKILMGTRQERFPYKFPIIPGWDAAGVVSACGKNVTQFKVGDEVFAFCRKPIVHYGTYAEYVCFEAKEVAFKPKNISMAQAASLPVPALTAWQALIDIAHLKSGQTVLIHAGAGGVGSLAIPLAKHIGAKVYTTASEKNHPYVKKLGADIAIDYKQKNFAEEIKVLEPKGVDVIFDCAGATALDQSYQLVKPGGHLVSVVNPTNDLDQKKAAQFHITCSYLIASPNGEELQEIARLFEEEKLPPPQISEYPLIQFAEALHQISTGTTKGKIVLKI